MSPIWDHLFLCTIVRSPVIIENIHQSAIHNRDGAGQISRERVQKGLKGRPIMPAR